MLNSNELSDSEVISILQLSKKNSVISVSLWLFLKKGINQMHYYNLLFISMTEIFFIALIAFLLFGTKKLPEVVKGLGKGYREFQKASEQIKEEINKVTEDIKKEANKVADKVKVEVEDKDKPKDFGSNAG